MYGCRLAPDPELRAVIDEALAELGGPREASAEFHDRSALGKYYCTEARYVPTLLVHLRALDGAGRQRPVSARPPAASPSPGP